MPIFSNAVLCVCKCVTSGTRRDGCKTTGLEVFYGATTSKEHEMSMFGPAKPQGLCANLDPIQEQPHVSLCLHAMGWNEQLT